MKKYVLLSMLAVAGFTSCGKDDQPEIDPTDGVALSSKVKVYYSETVKGTIPAATDQALVLQSEDGDVVAIDGRYTIIKPRFSVGAYSAAGYLVQFEGNSSSYFKVDYTLARNARKAQEGQYKTEGEFFPGDSAIIFKLPENIKSGTFTVNVAAFSAGGSVSNTIKYIVEVKQPGGLPSLNGTWQLSGTKKIGFDTAWKFNVYKADTIQQMVYCVSNKPTTVCPNGQMCDGIYKPTYITQTDKFEYVLGSGGAFKSTEVTGGRMPNWATSTCDAMAFTSYSNTFTKTGGWNYDESLKSIYIVYDSNGDAGTSYLEVAIIPVEVKGNKIILTRGTRLEEYTKK
ncbi:hypothetical protein [uncultured Chitinophaga sp.]|uniref:hypothetical protein n=1 Tax=uncultured Chitinophaga sp. TaxID=339340 RepID=UPI0025CF6736|nr:hypothetical protein [uncultured Chitinophaga sp.]